MKLNDLKPTPGSTKRKTRKGRGEAAGKGKTAGRGTKGTGARKNVPLGFEGGQMPLQRRLPKLPGFNPRNRVEFSTVNVSRLDDSFEAGDTVTPETLVAKGLVRSNHGPVKILGNGEIAKDLTVSAHAFSASAQSKIVEAGGSVELIQRRAAAADDVANASNADTSSE